MVGLYSKRADVTGIKTGVPPTSFSEVYDKKADAFRNDNQALSEFRASQEGYENVINNARQFNVELENPIKAGEFFTLRTAAEKFNAAYEEKTAHLSLEEKNQLFPPKKMEDEIRRTR